MSDEVVWMTYEALAERLGIEKESARQRARRGMWARRKDNAGRLTVGVPVDLLEAPPEALRDTRHEPLPDEGNALHDTRHEADENRYLNRYVEKIEQALELSQEKIGTLERERDEARDRAVAAEKAGAVISAQVEALNSVLAVERERAAEERRQAEERVAVERQRVAEWQAVADRFASQAERLAEARRSWWSWKRRA
jgi:chromosome segregation ATPase